MAWLVNFLILAALGGGAWWFLRQKRISPASAPLLAPAEEDEDEWEEYDEYDDEAEAAPRDSKDPREAGKPKESVDSLKAKERMESTEHGRTILEWLRKLRFQEVSVEEAIDTGNPDERASLKQLLTEVVNNFNDFKARMLELFPSAADLPSLAAAESAIKVFSHGIAILAKLEIANSIADSMQIATQASDRAKAKMSELMVDIQKAAEEVLQFAQEQEHERQSQESVEQHAAAEQDGHNKRRRRRRRRSHGGMASAKGAARRVNAGDLNGDGVADSLQGLSRTESPIALEKPAFEGLDMQQLRELGKMLALNAANAQNMEKPSLAMADVQAGDRIAPDDMQLSEQEKIKRERESSKVNGQGM